MEIGQKLGLVLFGTSIAILVILFLDGVRGLI